MEHWSDSDSGSGPSGLWQRWDAINRSDLPSELRHTLLSLLHYIGTDAECWPSQERLASDLGVSTRQLQRRIDTLIRRGIVTRSHRRTRAARGESQTAYGVRWGAVAHDTGDAQHTTPVTPAHDIHDV